MVWAFLCDGLRLAPGIKEGVRILVWTQIHSVVVRELLNLITSQLLQCRNGIDKYPAMLIVLRSAGIK